MCDDSKFSDEGDVSTGNEDESGIGQQHCIAKDDFRLGETVPHGGLWREHRFWLPRDHCCLERDWMG